MILRAFRNFISEFQESRQAAKAQVQRQKAERTRPQKAGRKSFAQSPSQVEYTAPPGTVPSPEIEFTATAELVQQPSRDRYAEPEDYDPLPILTLRDWDFGKGLNSTSEGFAFTAPDGKIWPAGKCRWEMWPELGVLAFNAVGEQYHLVDLRSPSFSPGRPIRLVLEPNNRHSKTGDAMSIRDVSMTRRAGYVSSGEASRLRSMLDGQPFYAMVLSADYEDSERTKRSEIKVVVFRPGRVIGTPATELHPPLGEVADHAEIS